MSVSRRIDADSDSLCHGFPFRSRSYSPKNQQRENPLKSFDQRMLVRNGPLPQNAPNTQVKHRGTNLREESETQR